MAKAPDFGKQLTEALEGVRLELPEIMRPLRLMGIASEAVQEVASARAKHGSNADLADGTGKYASVLREATERGGHESLFDVSSTGQAYIPDNEDMERLFKDFNDDQCAAGRKHTRLGILLEEAFEAAASENPAELRAELIQTIAMGLDWVADLDARESLTDVDEVCS